MLLPGHDVPLGRYTTVRRLLPQRARRMVGAWCFVDHFGPDDVAQRPGMEVPPHPHTGLQTVTWLLDGEIVHRDSLGNVQPIRPGQLNVMTSGHGIAHSERSPATHPPVMHGVQLWVALPDPARAGAAGFAHHADLPRWRNGDWDTPCWSASWAASGPRRWCTRRCSVRSSRRTGRRRRRCACDPASSTPCWRWTAGPGSTASRWSPARCSTSARAGTAGAERRAGQPTDAARREPFDEPLVMWWNFVGRSHEEVVTAREDWMAGRDRFGSVADDAAPPLPAPELPSVRLKARDRRGDLHG